MDDSSPGYENLRTGLAALRAGMSHSGQPGQRLMAQLVDGRTQLRSAMNHLEDDDPEQFAAAHAALDQLGQLIRQRWPDACALTFRDGTYWQECPVALAHNRVGLSPRIRVITSQCSICERDPEDCAPQPHIPGRIYDDKICTSVFTQWEIIDVALVARPCWPDARFTGLGIDMAQLKQTHGADLTQGTRLLCDYCLHPCPGLSLAFRSATHA